MKQTEFKFLKRQRIFFNAGQYHKTPKYDVIGEYNKASGDFVLDCGSIPIYKQEIHAQFVTDSTIPTLMPTYPNYTSPPKYGIIIRITYEYFEDLKEKHDLMSVSCLLAKIRDDYFDMLSSSELEINGHDDWKTDTYYIKIKSSIPHPKLAAIAEGQDYPHINLDKMEWNL